MDVNSHNDWDSLEEIIVGRADFAHIPPVDSSMKNFMFANLSNEEIKKHVGSYNQDLLKEANEDLDILSEVLEDCGVVVHRPERTQHHQQIIKDESFDFSDLSKPTLMNNEILFDAPNVIRINKDLIFQISNSGNEKGAEWLERMFPEYKIHIEYDAYSGAHFDSTVIPLREGLVLLNGLRCNQDNYPKFFDDWERIFFTDIISTNSEDS